MDKQKHASVFKHRATIDNLIYQMIARVEYELNNAYTIDKNTDKKLADDLTDDLTDDYRKLYDLKMSNLCDEMTNSILDLIDLIANEKTREQVKKTLQNIKKK